MSLTGASDLLPSPPAAPRSIRSLLPGILIVLGTGLRLLHPLDFEWKEDEQWSYEAAQKTAHGAEKWSWTGMPSSIGMKNPGMSLWPFTVMAYVLRTPFAMNLAVILLNVLALCGFYFWIRTKWPESDREIGLWTIALFAVSPMPILFSRKIWPQDLFPIFLLPWFWFHSRRERPLAAFGWGLAGSLLAQLHMAGGFAVAGLFMATFILDRKSVRWVPWVIGSTIGALPFLPWLIELGSGGRHVAAERSVSLEFFWTAFKTAWGIDLKYTLGSHNIDYLKGPIVGRPSGLIALAHLGLCGSSLYAGYVFWVDRKSIELSPPLRIYLLSVILGGSLLQITCVPIFAHYMIAWSPWLHLPIAWILSRRPRWLVVVALLQLIVSFSFLQFIHHNSGAPKADYGLTYQAQMNEGAAHTAR
jgi:hypothetical protein